MLQNIPLELRERDQWVVSGPDKKPLNPRTGQLASPTDPATWGTFNEAVRSGHQNIGFVFTPWDPYCIIDLDNKPDNPATEEQLERHNKILATFKTYTERSVSGQGYHLILKGSVPSGVHRDNVEIYSEARYMICTGNVVNQFPIADGYQEVLDQMYGQMAPKTLELEQRDGALSDAEVIEIAMAAANAEKFNALCAGDTSDYPSQSEADFALLSILCFYTKDNAQVRRLFRMSALGKRDKAQRNDKYINYALGKIRAQEPPPVDFAAIKEMAGKVCKAPLCPTTDSPAELHGVELPPGLIGEIAQYIYHSAVRPVPEVALCAALALASGICGRSYNVSGTGLNQYIMLLAKTGAGKEGASNGIDRLINELRQTIPVADQFIGPAVFASGQALIRQLDDQPCFVSVLGEFGLTLQQICGPRANSAQQMLRRVLLDLYTKSGWDKVLRPSVYSDKEKNTKAIQAPSLTILGESTPETFFDGLDSSHISEGLIPRFTVVEYKGIRPPKNRAAGSPPPGRLIQRLADLITIALTTTNNNTCANIQIQDDALRYLDKFDIKADDKINATNDIEVHLWNRAHLKALKLAGLIAVGQDPHQPVITMEAAVWAVAFIEKEIEAVAGRFRTGDVGTGDSKQIAEVKRVIKEYLSGGYKLISNRGIPKQMYEDGLVPLVYLSTRLINLSAFKADRRGGSAALKATLNSLVDSGVLVEIPSLTVRNRYKRGGVCYAIERDWG